MTHGLVSIPSKGATASCLLNIGSSCGCLARSPMQRDALPKVVLMLHPSRSSCSSKLTPTPVPMCMTAGGKAEVKIAMSLAVESCT